jgi:hypothetical protein
MLWIKSVTVQLNTEPQHAQAGDSDTSGNLNLKALALKISHVRFVKALKISVSNVRNLQNIILGLKFP